MPADYDQIRDDNISRYGWDTAVLDLLGNLYSERTHFIFELLQNAEDAGAKELTFELFADRLEVRHDGRPFTEDDVRGVCGVGKGTKADDLTKIGKFGIGFKSVYAYTRSPHIYSGGEFFRIENYVRPFAVDPIDGIGSQTLFVFPFDRDEPSAAVAVEEISSALGEIALRTLLFLMNIERVRIRGVKTVNAVLERIATSRTNSSRHVLLAKKRGYNSEQEEWFTWQRPLGALDRPKHRVEVGLLVKVDKEERRIAKLDSSPLVVFFPTQKETFLGFLIQRPYRTTPARDNVPEHDEWNKSLVRETAALVAEMLVQLRAEGLLTVDVLQAMPLDASRFERGTMFRALFDAVRAALIEQRLIPVADGRYEKAGNLKLARGTGLREMLSPDQLWQLYKSGQLPTFGRFSFAHDAITENRTPQLWRYLREQLGVDEVTPESVVGRVSGEFLEVQSDTWIVTFYAFLQQNPALSRMPRYKGDQPGVARLKPIIRLEDGTHIRPFDARGLPAAYLPGPTGTAFNVVRRAVAEATEARQFLETLGFRTPDVVAEVLDHILPRYSRLDAASVDPEQHEADLDCMARALADTPANRRQQLLEQLRNTAFVTGKNALTGELRLMKPIDVYERTADLAIYLAGNPDAWFLADSYRLRLEMLRGLGVRQSVVLRARPGYRGKGRTGDLPGRGRMGADNGEWLFSHLCKALRALWCRRTVGLGNEKYLRAGHSSCASSRANKPRRPSRAGLREGAVQVCGTGRGRRTLAPGRPAGRDRRADFGR